jgi:chromosome segregation ATPase
MEKLLTMLKVAPRLAEVHKTVTANMKAHLKNTSRLKELEQKIELNDDEIKEMGEVEAAVKTASLELTRRVDALILMMGGVWSDHKDLWAMYKADQASFKELTAEQLRAFQELQETLNAHADETHRLFKVVSNNTERVTGMAERLTLLTEQLDELRETKKAMTVVQRKENSEMREFVVEQMKDCQENIDRHEAAHKALLDSFDNLDVGLREKFDNLEHKINANEAKISTNEEKIITNKSASMLGLDLHRIEFGEKLDKAKTTSLEAAAAVAEAEARLETTSLEAAAAVAEAEARLDEANARLAKAEEAKAKILQYIDRLNKEFA